MHIIIACILLVNPEDAGSSLLSSTLSYKDPPGVIRLLLGQREDISCKALTTRMSMECCNVLLLFKHVSLYSGLSAHKEKTTTGITKSIFVLKTIAEI